MTEVEEDVLRSVQVVRVERRRRSSDPEIQGTSERGKLSTLSLPEIVVEVRGHPPNLNSLSVCDVINGRLVISMKIGFTCTVKLYCNEQLGTGHFCSL